MKKTILIFLATLLLFSCSKDSTGDPTFQLPPETQTGANTFGCLINGKVLIPRSGVGSIAGPDEAVYVWGGYPNSTDYYEIDVRDYKSNRTAQILIHLQSAHLKGVSNFVVDKSNGFSSIDGLDHNYIHCRVFNEATNSYQYYRSFDNSGLVKVTRYDFIKRIISGTFSCRVRNSTNPSDEIEIKQGRFDIKWDTISEKFFP
jgi:hypothetical protein